MRQFLLVFAAIPSFATAQAVISMTGVEITQALEGRALIYEGGETQDFRSSGATLYNAGRDSWGYWAVRGDQYCSQWPPRGMWDCYDMARVGEALRFIADDGSYTDGEYTD